MKKYIKVLAENRQMKSYRTRQSALSLESLESRVLLNGSGFNDNSDNDDAALLAAQSQNLVPAIDMLEYTKLSKNAGFSVSDVATDTEGNIYVAGNAGKYSGTVDKGGFKQLIQGHSGDTDGFVAKFSADGVGQWLTFIGGSESDSISQISVDSTGIWLAGSTYSYKNSDIVFPGYADVVYGGYFLAHLSSAGSWQWTSGVSEQRLNEYESTSYSIGCFYDAAGGPGITFAGNGIAYGLVSIYDDSKPYDYKRSLGVVSFSSATGEMSVVSDFEYGFSDLPTENVQRSMIVSPDKVISIVGSQTNSYGYDVMVMTPISASLVTGFDGVVQDYALDAQGNVLVSGYLNQNSRDGFVAKHLSDGQQAWQTVMGGSAMDECFALAFDASGNVYFGGESYSSDFPFVNTIHTPTVSDNYFPYYGELNADGQVLWNTGVGKVDDRWLSCAREMGIAAADNAISVGWDAYDYDTYQPELAVCRVGTAPGEDLPVASLVSDYLTDDQALLTDINKAKYLDVKFDDTKTTSVNGDELQIAGEGAAGVTIKGKPKLIDKTENIWRYVVDGVFTAGPVVLSYLSNTFTNTAGQPNAAVSETFYAIPDMAPLAFSVDTKDFTWNATTKRYDYQGSFGIGMKPATGSSFQSLVTVSSGAVSFDQTRIYGDGIVTTAITDANLNLFEGDFEFVIGQAKTSMLLESGVSLAGAWEVAGCDYQFTGMTLAAGKIQTQGTMHLPTEFGSVELAVSGDQAIELASTGVSLTGATLTMPDAELDLPWFKMKAEDLSVEYIAAKAATTGVAAQPEKLRFRGKVSLPNFFNATADLTKDELNETDGYLEINSNSEIKWFGKLSVEKIVIVPKRWEIKEASLELREGEGGALSVQGDCKVVIPPGMEIVAGLGFVNEEFNYIQLGVGDLNIPIGTTGAFLQEITGKVDNMADEDATKIKFGGGLGFTAGPEVKVELPDWAGGDQEGSLAEFGLTGAVNHTELSGTGSLKMVGGLIEGSAVAALNWDKGTLTSGCTLSALDGLITIDGKFNADSKMNVNIAGQGKVTLPSIIPLWGGRQISGANSQLSFSNDSDYSNDFVAGWGSISMSILGKERRIGLGLKVNFDGSYSILGSKEAARTEQSIVDPSVQKMSKGMDVLADTAASQIVEYKVSDENEWLMINAQWDSGTIDNMYLLAPDGTRYDDFVNSDKVTIIDDLSGNDNKVIFVDAPEKGTWQLVIESQQPLTGLAFDGYQDSVMPEVTIEQIEYNSTAGNVAVSYETEGSLVGRQIAFYYDTDAADADGVLLGYDTDGDGVFSGDISGAASGDYYIYATVFDGSYIPTTAYSQQAVTITQVATDDLTEVAFGTGAAGKVTYTDADGTVVTVTIKGDSGVLNFTGDDIVATTAKGAAKVTGTNLALQSVTLDGSGPATLSFAAKGGTDKTATIGNISGGSLTGLSGSGVILAGNIELTGSLGALKWGVIDDMVNISADAPVKGLAITATTVGQQVNIEIDGILKSLIATQYSSGSITADSVGKVTVKQGNFDVAVNATAGDILALTVAGTVSGDISASASIKAVTTKGTLSAIMRGTTIGKITALDMIDGLLSAAGDITSVTLKGQMTDSCVIAGYDLGADMAFSDDDLPGIGNINSISVGGQFSASYLLAGAIPDVELAQVTGLELPWVAASGKISKIKLGSINYESTDEFGLYAADSIAVFKIGKNTAVSSGNFVIMTY